MKHTYRKLARELELEIPDDVKSPFESLPSYDLRSLDTLEQTYLRAKNGANEVDHNQAAF